MLITIIVVLYFSLKAVVIKPINNMNMALKNLSEGEADLTRRLKKEREDEIGYGIDLFNKFIERIQNIINGVSGSTINVFNATEKLSKGNEDLATRTTELAASITETSVTMEEFASSVKQNTENAEDADKTLNDFNSEIKVKRELIDNVTLTMKEISNSSKKIDNIVSVINDISFQTNLLALNAAVEAARAGEAGRGFAVVASEVRNLAGKTAESSKSIQKIVTANVESTNKGMRLVNDTSKLFSKIIDVMETVVNKINTITSGSREQTTGIDQINTTIAQMDSVSNQNASFVNEMSETSKNLKSSAIELQELISQFKLQ
jgi:methyl-accepting chemotaxis protein